MEQPLMLDTVSLIGAPPAMQPGGYVPEAYQKRIDPKIPELEFAVLEEGGKVIIELHWACPNPVRDIADTDSFPDAAAVLVPTTMNAPWITMGSETDPVEAVLWRADHPGLWHMQAKGLGSMQRREGPQGWSSDAEWSDGHWRLRLELSGWVPLDQFGRFAVALWRGDAKDRGGLKSVTNGWLSAR